MVIFGLVPTMALAQIDRKATKETQALYQNLFTLRASGTMLGHQDALAYGLNKDSTRWVGGDNKSDIKTITGEHPGVVGHDLGHLELGRSQNLDEVPFDKMKQSVEAKPFSDTKMSTAKIVAKNNCMSVNQVKEICKLFSMDDDKLTYAKFAYDYCVDKANYYQVSEVFAFSGTTEDLNAFLEKH